MDSESRKKSSSNNLMMMVGVLILLILAGAGGYYYGHKSANNRFMTAMQNGGPMPSGAGRPGGPGGMPGMNMPQASPPAVSDQQTAQLALGTSKTVTDKTFNITGGNFYFVPNKIMVNKGDKVTFVMTNGGGMHDLVIDELGVKTPVIKSGEAASATFTADKTGSFVYYCDVPGHREKGMWGTLTVQ